MLYMFIVPFSYLSKKLIGSNKLKQVVVMIIQDFIYRLIKKMKVQNTFSISISFSTSLYTSAKIIQQEILNCCAYLY